jgi:AcrR family transcriptional regulator
MTGRQIRVSRAQYRHGNLRNALLEAGIALARAGGPQAVVLREATRQAGVAPNAAYRHFASREALLDSVRDFALSQLAQKMEAQLRLLGTARATSAYARDTLGAIGIGYLLFAREQPGLFRTAFAVRFDRNDGTRIAQHGDSGLNPFQLLATALDRMVATGTLAAAQRPDAEYLAWSAVHGLALLGLDGPLRHLKASEYQQLSARVVKMVELGLTSAGRLPAVRRTGRGA